MGRASIYPFLEPAGDIELTGKPDEGGYSLWKSTGNDPGLVIRLPVIRPRFLQIRLHSRDKRLLSPQIYFDFGTGFREPYSVHIPEGNEFCLTLDVGRLGFIRSIRLDPSFAPGIFACRVEALKTGAQVDQGEYAWQTDFPDGHVERINKAGILDLVVRRITPWRKGSRLRACLDTIYELAECAPLPADSVAKGLPWLSIIVPVYNAPVSYLDDLLASFKQQETCGVEVVFSDDASTSRATLDWLRKEQAYGPARVVFSQNNGGIAAATNAGIDHACGTWIALLDHDDVIAPHALKMVRQALLDHPHARFLYTDEVVVDAHLKPKGLMAKPAYDPVLLSGVNYINHFSFYRRDRLEKIGRLRDGFQGSQDYDLLLRYLSGLADDEILHLPYPAYWWRRDGASFSARHLDRATDAARRALREYFACKGKPVEAGPAITPTLHRVNFTSAASPRISVIIPSRDAFALITTVMRGLLEETDYPDLEILIVDNGSEDPRILDFYDAMRRSQGNVHIHLYKERFNFARAINRGFSRATGEHFLLLNNDIAILHPDWLSEMVSCLNFDQAGIVGARLLYPDGRLQHAGVVAGFGGLAGHWYLGKPADFGGPMSRLHVRASMTCVTAAAMLVSGSCRAALGEMDEKNFAVAYNDVDYCLRAYAKGFRTIWTPFASLIHHESATRGSENRLENRARFEREKQNLRRLHHTGNFSDPASSPFYGQEKSTPELKAYKNLPSARHWYGSLPEWDKQPERCLLFEGGP